MQISLQHLFTGMNAKYSVISLDRKVLHSERTHAISGSFNKSKPYKLGQQITNRLRWGTVTTTSRFLEGAQLPNWWGNGPKKSSENPDVKKVFYSKQMLHSKDFMFKKRKRVIVIISCENFTVVWGTGLGAKSAPKEFKCTKWFIWLKSLTSLDILCQTWEWHRGTRFCT